MCMMRSEENGENETDGVMLGSIGIKYRFAYVISSLCQHFCTTHRIWILVKLSITEEMKSFILRARIGELLLKEMGTRKRRRTEKEKEEGVGCWR